MDTRLPYFCATRNFSGEIIIIKRGEFGYYRGEMLSLATDEDVAHFNAQHRATPAAIAAMEMGSMWGMEIPGAQLEAGEDIAARRTA